MYRIVFILLLSSFLASGQNNPDAKRDYVWVYGNNYHSLYSTEYTIDFNNGSFQTNLFHHNIHLWANNCSVADTAGNLLFFSNGQQIVNKNGDIMDNGDSLVTSGFYNYYNLLSIEPSYPQSIIILPQPHYPNLYRVFHVKYEWPGGVMTALPVCTGIYMSTVDMNENNGLGKVIIKSQLIISDTSVSLGGLTAVRHGNGRDWWILVPGSNTLKYFLILLDPEGIHIQDVLIDGLSLPQDASVTSCFSADGTYFAKLLHPSANFAAIIDLLAFNRCSGVFTPSLTLQINSDHFVGGLSFSSNSRFLYVNDEQYCYQFDMQSQNIPNSKIEVAHYDGFDPNGYPTVFGFHKLAPDGKIYVGAGHSKYLHKIDNPNVKGDSCNFIQRFTELPGNNMWGSMPNMPNFRLGRWVGSECDNLYNGINDITTVKTIGIKASPNPASQDIHFELDVINNSQPMQLSVYDDLGREIDEIPVSPFQGIINYNVGKFSNGLYYGMLTRMGENVGKVKFVINK